MRQRGELFLLPVRKRDNVCQRREVFQPPAKTTGFRAFARQNTTACRALTRRFVSVFCLKNELPSVSTATFFSHHPKKARRFVYGLLKMEGESEATRVSGAKFPRRSSKSEIPRVSALISSRHIVRLRREQCRQISWSHCHFFVSHLKK